MMLFDIHCDTAHRIFENRSSFIKNEYHISLERVEQFDLYVQNMAIWCDKKYSDEECYLNFFKTRDFFIKDFKKSRPDFSFSAKKNDLINNLSSYKKAFILSVEDARLLSNDIERLQHLYDADMRILTLTWAGKSCIGGAYDTNFGLTCFGKDVVKRCFEIGVIPDISHASIKTSFDVFEIAERYSKSVIATHSNSYFVYNHKRNLTNEQFEAIKKSGGIVGISLCRSHLGDDSLENVNTNHILKHIEHYLSIGGEHMLALGCDFDGADLPEDFTSISDVYKIANLLARQNYSEDLINSVFWKNALNFFQRSEII